MRKILKQHFQRFLSLFLLCMLCIVTILGGRLSAPYAYAESNRDLEFDKTNVMDDLTGATINGKPFNLYDYPYDSTGVYKAPRNYERCGVLLFLLFQCARELRFVSVFL